jgi:flavin reductase (DIM6/NTAB) family NADH-FMN oxidoreductase RutF
MAKSFYYDTANIDLEALQRISSGLYVLTTFDKKIANGCIIDSIAFASHKPKKIVVCISKGSLTAEMIKESNVFTLSALSQSAP